MRRLKAFTLIELLIVVAIIAILAAIAVPNFLEAQVRAKVSRAKTDMRTLDIGLSAYAIDFNRFPPGRMSDNAQNSFGVWPIRMVHELSTPVSYVTSTDAPDPFGPDKTAFKTKTTERLSYGYYSFDGLANSAWYAMMASNGAPVNNWVFCKGFQLESWGPDKTHDAATWLVQGAEYFVNIGEPDYLGRIYDPTNGTISRGDVVRFGGGVPGYVATYK